MGRKRKANRERNSAAQAAWRERKRNGQMICPLPVDLDTIDWLVDRGRLAEEDRWNRRAIGLAISKLKLRIVPDEPPEM